MKESAPSLSTRGAKAAVAAAEETLFEGHRSGFRQGAQRFLRADSVFVGNAPSARHAFEAPDNSTWAAFGNRLASQIFAAREVANADEVARRERDAYSHLAIATLAAAQRSGIHRSAPCPISHRDVVAPAKSLAAIHRYGNIALSAVAAADLQEEVARALE